MANNTISKEVDFLVKFKERFSNNKDYVASLREMVESDIISSATLDDVIAYYIDLLDTKKSEPITTIAKDSPKTSKPQPFHDGCSGGSSNRMGRC